MKAHVRRVPAPRLLVLIALAACSTVPPMPEPGDDHPASPNAAAAPVTPPSDTLRLPAGEGGR